MDKLPKTQQKYFCKHCGYPISMITGIYGQSQCKQCQNRKFFIDKDDLYKEYLQKNKAITEIAKIYKCCYGTIYKWLLNYNIPIKSKRETHLGKKRPEQSLMMMSDKNPTKGTHRPKSVRNQISKARIGKYSGKNNPMFGKKVSYKCSYGHGGKYKNTWFRSSYEIAYAKYLDCNKIKWLYESKAFDLGETTYRPDFYLIQSNTYIEVKGYWTKDALYKFNLFKQLYPKIKIIVFDKTKLMKEGIDVR
jgi:transposase-like protein